jgi:hypothetical protein
MTDIEEEGDESAGDALKTLLAGLVRVVGLLATLYLVGISSLLALYSIGFINYSTPDFAWWKVADVAKDSLPLLAFAAIGIAGLKLWPRGRYRLWGLSAILFQTAMAIYLLASPEGLLALTDWRP